MVGAGLGGLSAAIHLRRAGYRVTVYERNSRVGGRANRIEHGGFRCDTGPTLLNYPWIFEQLFEAAGRRLGDYVRLLPVDPSVEFRWPDGARFQLSSDMNRLLAECERLDPGSSSSMLDFFQDAAAKFRLSFDKLVTSNETSPLRWIGRLRVREILRTSIWRSLDGELARFFKSRYIREAFGSYGMYLGGSPFELPGVFSILPYGEIAHGLWLPKGGIHALVEAIARIAGETGVEIETDTDVSRIDVAEGRVRGIEFTDGRYREHSIVVSNVDRPSTDRDLLGGAHKSSRKPPKMTPGVMTFYWGVRGRIEGLGHHTIFLPEDYRGAFRDLCQRRRIPSGLPFYAAIPSETDPDLAPAGASTLFVLVPTPLLSEMPGCDWKAAACDVRARVLATLGLDPARIVFEEVWTPEDWSERFGLFDGSAFGASHILRQIGPLRQPNYSPEVGGLYYAGASTTPGTGMPMVALSGRMAAERIVERHGVPEAMGIEDFAHAR